SRRHGTYELVFRLPTEAEWEFACRAGSSARYSFGEASSELSEFGLYRDSSQGIPQRTAALTSNAADLFDMHGNVWEWCEQKILRGGSCRSSGYDVRSASRLAAPAGRTSDFCGLRIAASLTRATTQLTHR